MAHKACICKHIYKVCRLIGTASEDLQLEEQDPYATLVMDECGPGTQEICHCCKSDHTVQAKPFHAKKNDVYREWQSFPAKVQQSTTDEELANLVALWLQKN